MSVNVSITAVPRLPDAQREAAFVLHSQYFSGVRRDVFMGDMAEKNHAILLHSQEGHLVGFSFLQYIDLEVDGARVRFVFSGNTVVDQAYRNTPALAGAFGHQMLRLLDEGSPDDELYWFLITKGFRTYRFLPVFFREFYPRYDVATPPRYARLMRAIALHKYNGRFDAEVGIVRATETTDWLSPPHSAVPPERLEDPHVRFFADANSSYARGDELACIARISRENFNRFAHRTLAATRVKWCE